MRTRIHGMAVLSVVAASFLMLAPSAAFASWRSTAIVGVDNLTSMIVAGDGATYVFGAGVDGPAYQVRRQVRAGTPFLSELIPRSAHLIMATKALSSTRGDVILLGRGTRFGGWPADANDPRFLLAVSFRSHRTGRWTARRFLPGSNGPGEPLLEVDGSGALVVTWAHAAGNEILTWMSRRDPASGRWSAATRLLPPGLSTFGTVTAGSTVVAVGTDAGGSLVSASLHGSTWTSEVLGPPFAGGSGDPRANARGDVIEANDVDNGSTYSRVVRVRDAVTGRWSAPFSVPIVSWSPLVAASTATGSLTAWVAPDGDGYEIFSADVVDGAFSTPVRIAHLSPVGPVGTASLGWLDAAAGTNGRSVIVWGQYRRSVQGTPLYRMMSAWRIAKDRAWTVPTPVRHPHDTPDTGQLVVAVHATASHGFVIAWEGFRVSDGMVVGLPTIFSRLVVG